MCDTFTESVIETVVNEKVQNNEIFTAFDITILAQGQLKSDKKFDPSIHRHRAMKNDIHRIINSVVSGVYDRQLRDVGASSDAHVYYPYGSDPANYVALTVADLFKVKVDPVVASVLNDSFTPVPATSDTKICNADARGTVCISKFLIENAGMKAGDVAVVYTGKDDLNRDALILVGRANAASVVADSLATYTVDYHGNIRVTVSVLSEAKMVAANYDCDGNSTKVFIRPC
jgi:hypothetical protein